MEAHNRDQLFADLIVPETEVLYRVARTLTGQQADAEDAVQEALLRAYRALDSFDGRYPRAWLLKILRNVVYNRTRRRRPHLLREPEMTMANVEETGRGGGNPEDMVMDRRFSAAVEQAFDALPRKYKEVLTMVDIEGLSYADAAEALGVPEGTVMSRLHRARHRIRRHLDTPPATPGGLA